MRKKRLAALLAACFLAILLSACGMEVERWDSFAGMEGSGITQITKEENSLYSERVVQTTEAEEIGKEADLYLRCFQEHEGRYAFDTLGEIEKYWYVDIYNILISMGKEEDLHEAGMSVIGIEGLERIFQCVFQDHPEIFYVSGYTYTQYTVGEETVRITFSGTYTMDAQEVEIRKEQIEIYVEEFLGEVDAETTEYEKVKFVYEYLISHTEYNLSAPENQNICSVFIGRESVCQGYAKATQYLLERLGVEATLVQGNVEGEGHAWNLVRIDGEYYYVDTTWGDASYRVDTSYQETEEGKDLNKNDLPAINYDYLCVTTAQLQKTHIINSVVEMPLCSAIAANYYVMEGAYFTEYNEEQLKSLFQKAYETGRQDVTLKSSQEEIHQAIFEQLITNQKIFNYLEIPGGTVAYVDNMTQLSLTFWLSRE